MWLSEQREQAVSPQGCALTGPVTLAGDPAAVWLEGERRGVRVYAPGGYHWVPRAGEEVLVLKAGREGESPCVLGSAAAPGEALQPGEVRIEGGGASVTLRENGQICLSGQVYINGVHLDPDALKGGG